MSGSGDERMLVEGGQIDLEIGECVTPARCSAGGGSAEKTKTGDGEIDGSRTGVCGFQCVQSVVVVPPTV